jgi:hypothetical protein
MIQISSKGTFFYKRVFPIFWFGFLILFVVIPTVVGFNTGKYPPPPFLIVPVFMIAVGYFVMRKLIFDLVDVVVDLGDALLVKNGNQEDRIALFNIVNVNYSPLVNPPRVTLSLRKPSKFGAQVAFCAPVRFVPFAPSPVIDALIARVDAARRRQ